MATIFLSYKNQERPLAASFAEELTQLGHRVVSDMNLQAAGQPFREALTDQLVRSDAVVCLLSEKAVSSPFIMGEVGAARALKQSAGQPLLIPVVVGEFPIPTAVDDINVVYLKNEKQDMRSAALEVHQGLTAYIEGRGQRRRLFVSHRHADAEVVEALVRVIESAFEIRKSDIRCTSLQPYTLRAGERTAERLREEINRAEAVLGVVTPDVRESSYVLFELGASWGRKGMTTFPLLARGATVADVPAPIGDLHTLSLESTGECHQLVEDLRDLTTLTPRANVGGAIAERVADLVAAAGRQPGRSRSGA